MGKIETPWGEFEKLDEEVDIKTTPHEEEVEETTVEATEEVIEPDSPNSKEGEGKKEETTVVPNNDLAKTFDSVAEALEDSELMFLDSDKEYDATAEGFKEMLKDNMEAFKSKLEKEFEEKEQKLIQEYDSRGTVKIADMDTSDENQALALLEKYYAETGFTEEEVKDKLEEVKALDSFEKEAKIAQRFLVKQEKEQEAVIAKDAESREAKKQKEISDYVSGVKGEIDAIEEMAGFKLTPSMKSGFKDYLFKVGKEGLTPAQKAAQDPTRRLRLAFLDYVDFNKKDFEIKAKTALANEMEKKKSRFTSTQTSSKGVTIDIKEERQGLTKGFTDFWSSNTQDND